MSEIHENYKIIKPLGSQSKRKFGSVFLIQNKLTFEYAVLKSLVKLDTNINLQERLLKEAEFSFEFPGLPKTIELFETDTEINLIKSYSEGITLDEYWKSVKIRNRKSIILEILLKLCELLKVLQNHCIVHCDLKPSNILVNVNNKQIEVALIDFGLALNTTEENKRQTLFPLGYAAPELLLNHLEIIDHRTDQFSIGTIIWKLFTDKLPLTHPNPSIFTNLQLTHPLPDHIEIPKGFFPVLLKMCSKHQFKTAPNLISKEERLEYLIDGMTSRYNNYEEIIQAFQDIKIRKNFFGF